MSMDKDLTPPLRANIAARAVQRAHVERYGLPVDDAAFFRFFEPFLD